MVIVQDWNTVTEDYLNSSMRSTASDWNLEEAVQQLDPGVLAH
jgi:hypothetical protein